MKLAISIGLSMGFPCMLLFLLLEKQIVAQETKEATGITWDSPKMKTLAKEFKDVDPGNRPHKEGEEAMKKLEERKKKKDEILHKLSKKELQDLARSIHSLPIDIENKDEFIFLVIRQCIVVMGEEGDRDSLVQLLSERYFERVGHYYYTEHFLAKAKNLKDPILILQEAYEKSKDPENREQIAAAVRRAFTKSGIQGGDDAEFIKNAMEWYQKNKDDLTVSAYYEVITSFRVKVPQDVPPLYMKKTKEEVQKQSPEENNHPEK